jgi:DNA mismatch repair protein MutS2
MRIPPQNHLIFTSTTIVIAFLRTGTLGFPLVAFQNKIDHHVRRLSKFQPRATKVEQAQAGEDGYSLLRQPLTWDKDSDPVFETPKSLDENQNSLKKLNEDWFRQNRIAGSYTGLTTTSQDDVSNTENQKKIPKRTNDVVNVTDEFQQELDLYQRTMDTLDYPSVLHALQSECDTMPAKRIIDDAIHRRTKKISKKHKPTDVLYMGLTAHNVEGIHSRYQAVKEMQYALSGQAEIPKQKDQKVRKVTPPPMSSTFDIVSMMNDIDKGGVLDGPAVLEMSVILSAALKLRHWLTDLAMVSSEGSSQNKIPFQVLPAFGESIFIDPDMLDLLENAFDEDGRLSGTTFPGIGRLRAKVRTLKSDIMSTLDSLLSAPSIKNKLSLESGGALYSEVNGRIVIPINEKFRNSVGIVHDMSRSAKTAYVEPSEIVGPTNDMNQAMVELRQEENRVWRMLTQTIIENREDIERSVAVVAQIDLILARIRVGDRIAGVVPEVGDEGIISLKCAKHPVLLLRELPNVVGSDIDIGAGSNQGLVLTGPNSGGKTIILKLLGLFSLMAKDGIPVPALPNGARVDFFDPVLADIGDLQSVDEDLSTFSGHMLVCREVLKHSGKNALVLMDELGSGTDPNQGVAIAQAILEAILDTGSRVAITTHYLQLKQLAALDNRFSVGAMEFIKGRPTYKLLPGVVGESFALSVAERLRLPRHVIERAEELMDSETKQMGDLIRKIDEQAEELQKKLQDVQKLETSLRKRKEKIERDQVVARRLEAKKFVDKLEEKEKILEDILQKLKSDPSKKLIAKSWDEIKYIKRDALNEAENIPSILRRKQMESNSAAKQYSEMVPLGELRELPDIKAGDLLLICKKGSMRGKEAKVVNISGKRIDVSVNGMQMTMKINELALPPSSYEPKINDANEGPRISKMARKALAEAENSDIASFGETTGNSEGPTMRLKSNTVDCLGCSFEEARRKCEDKFSSVMMSKRPVVYILHGHGPQGVLKKKIRDWLSRDKQWVKKFSSADHDDGGDAFTKVELKSTLL